MNMDQKIKTLSDHLCKLGTFTIEDAKRLAKSMVGAFDESEFVAREIGVRAFFAARDVLGVGGFDASTPYRADPDDAPSGTQRIAPSPSTVSAAATSEAKPRKSPSPTDFLSPKPVQASIAEGGGDLENLARPYPGSELVLKGTATPNPAVTFEDPPKLDGLAQVLKDFEGRDAVDLSKENGVKMEIERLHREADQLSKEAKAIRDDGTEGWEGPWRDRMDRAKKLMDDAKAMMDGRGVKG